MAQDWRTAYFCQARSDYETLQLLEEAGAPFCQRLHYLQMATEKLAKGFATAPGGPQQPKVHRGYVHSCNRSSAARNCKTFVSVLPDKSLRTLTAYYPMPV